LAAAGALARSFARARIADCANDYFVAFSSKGRGVCPSCNTWRMMDKAAHLIDHVFPRLPVRQWVLSVPKRLSYFVRGDGAVLNMVLRIFLRMIAQNLQPHSLQPQQSMKLLWLRDQRGAREGEINFTPLELKA
jgi:Transposase zinc-binding domain